jgi:hypothetical protein
VGASAMTWHRSGVVISIYVAFVDIGGRHSRSMWAASTVVGFKVDIGGYVAFTGSVGDRRFKGGRLRLLTGAEVGGC